MSKMFDAILAELAGLAGRRQRDRGMQPTKWLLKWRTQISLSVAMNVGRAILDALPNCDRNWRCGDIAFSHADVLEASIGTEFGESMLSEDANDSVGVETAV